MARCAVIYVDGQIEIKQLDGLKDLQETVGGLIESLPLRDGADVYVNEEGKYTCYPNIFATFIMQINKRLNVGDYVSGNMIIVGAPDEDGNDTDIPQWVEELVEGINAPEQTTDELLKGLIDEVN